MLDFILVMGHVPGTNIDITFTEILIGIFLAGVMIYLHKIRPGLIKRTALELYLGLRRLISFAQTKRPRFLVR